MTKMIPIVVSVPADVAKRLREAAPSSTERAKLLRTFVLEGLNRHTLDCLWCRLKTKEQGK